jgi:type II secretory pathway pseudopilin PulG
MIVISIIALLAVLVINTFIGQIRKGNDARRKADLNRIKIAAEEYEKDHNCYPPPDLVVCDLPVGSPGTGLKPYINKIPCDPATKASYAYDYDNSSCRSWYRIFTDLQNTADPAAVPNIGPGSRYNFYLGSANAPVPVSSVPSPTSPPAGNPGDQFYGCRSGSCVPIGWDNNRPGPECDPNYGSSSCGFDQCGTPASPKNPCIPWH